MGHRRALRDRAAGADLGVHRRPRQPVPADPRAGRTDDDQRRGDRRHLRRDRRRRDRAAGADRVRAGLGVAVPPAQPLLPVRPRLRARRRDQRGRPARLSAGRSGPRLDRAGDHLRVRHQLAVDVGRGDTAVPPRCVPRLRPPRHRPVPVPRHPGTHGRRLPLRPRPDGSPRLVRGVRGRAVVHVRRHPADPQGQPGGGRLRAGCRRRRSRHPVRAAGDDHDGRARGTVVRRWPAARTPNVGGDDHRHHDDTGVDRPARPSRARPTCASSVVGPWPRRALRAARRRPAQSTTPSSASTTP